MYEALHYNFAEETTRGTAGPTPTTDMDVVELARGGDGQAFAQLFQTYNGQICTYLSRLVGNDDSGRDLAQETFIRAWKHLPGMQGDVQFKPWLYRIATNLARSHLRRERIIRWLPWREREQNSPPDVMQVAGPEERTGEAEYVRQVLAQLSPQSQVCLLLQLHAGFSQREIATFLEISEKSVSAYVSRGREQFRQIYRRMKGDAIQ